MCESAVVIAKIVLGSCRNQRCMICFCSRLCKKLSYPALGSYARNHLFKKNVSLECGRGMGHYVMLLVLWAICLY